MGNTLGLCPHDCKFCSVKTVDKVPAEEIVARFDELFALYRERIDGPYHPVIYNRGNVTNTREFPREVLDHVLCKFNTDKRVSYVSLNSREQYMTHELLECLADKRLSYAVHFIIGVESFSEKAPRILGKNTAGELTRAVLKLKWFNKQYARQDAELNYVFGLDSNLVFLPELYIEENQSREACFNEIRLGLEDDLAQLLNVIDPDVPVEINIHPYCKVDTLPYDDADLGELVHMLPGLRDLVVEHNKIPGNRQTHLFVGVEGDGYSTEYQRRQVQKWKPYIDAFNQDTCFGPQDCR
jgi:hypothetical protein